MGSLGFTYLSNTPELAAARRKKLDWYASVAQISQLVIVLSIPLGKLVISTLVKVLDTEGNSSLGAQKVAQQPGRKRTATARLARFVRILKFRSGAEVVQGCGTYQEWIFGLLWVAWLGFLCVSETVPAKDYMHLVKRFGLIAASQLPLHYLLAMKSPYSPVQILLKGTHELITKWHQVTGQIIFIFMALHVSCYSSALMQMNVFWKSARQPKIAVALCSAGLLVVLRVSSTAMFRRKWYSWFYKLHVVASAAVLVLLFFHVSHIRVYILESAAVLVFNIVFRMLSTRNLNADFSIRPASKDLVSILIKNQDGSTGVWLPGQHMYLGQNPSGIFSYFSKNPFTIATLPADSQTVALVVRCINGNTKTISAPASGLALREFDDRAPYRVSLEGPYGSSKYLEPPNNFSRVLLIAGGVGGSYIVPQWRFFVLAQRSPPEIRLAWAVKDIADAEWAFTYLKTDKLKNTSVGSQAKKMHLCVTGTRTLEREDAMEAAEAGFVVSSGRPDLKNLVDMTVFGNTGRSAVFVCGPRELVASARTLVGGWIDRGQDVFWHAEKFGI